MVTFKSQLEYEIIIIIVDNSVFDNSFYFQNLHNFMIKIVKSICYDYYLTIFIFIIHYESSLLQFQHFLWDRLQTTKNNQCIHFLEQVIVIDYFSKLIIDLKNKEMNKFSHIVYRSVSY